jgi:voltage-gated potassium channel
MATAATAATAEHTLPRSRAERWEEKTAWPLLALSMLWVGLSTVALTEYEPGSALGPLASAALIVIWAIFLVDFAIRLALTTKRVRYVRDHLLEVISLVLPFLRAFLLVFYLWRLPILRGSPQQMRTRFMLMAAAFGLVFVYVASTLVWEFEHDVPGANIVEFGDAIWWGFATIATVGYGDYTPITVPGRVVAVGLMLGGFIIVGSVTATVISALGDQIRSVASTVVRPRAHETPAQPESAGERDPAES